jgi:hypothetical protein
MKEMIHVSHVDVIERNSVFSDIRTKIVTLGRQIWNSLDQPGKYSLGEVTITDRHYL